MKKLHFGLIFILVITISVIFPLNGLAGSRWVLYDNFDSGVIDMELWDVDDSSADISIENGRAKFVHRVSEPNDSSWLIFKKNPEKIKKIRVKVWVVQAEGGDPFARIGGDLAKDEDGNLVFTQIRVRPERERVDCSAAAFGDPPNFEFKYDLFFALFKSPIEIVDERFKLTLEFDLSDIECEESDLGDLEYEFEDKLVPLDEFFKGIGTRNNILDEEAEDFIVYFDDVYVRYK